ncbi:MULTISPECIES: hypothetical protein [Mesorhizobium]|nr:hypothetical protein [Mesorhizobium sp.]
MKYENSNREEEHGPMKLATIHIGTIGDFGFFTTGVFSMNSAD